MLVRGTAIEPTPYTEINLGDGFSNEQGKEGAGKGGRKGGREGGRKIVRFGERCFIRYHPEHILPL
jgi:hypothetical protein